MCSTRSIHGLFVVVSIVFLTSVVWAQVSTGYDDVTVLKRDGWTYQHVGVQLSSEGSEIQVERSDGAILLLPFHSVFKILDAQGADITGDLIPAYSALPKPRLDNSLPSTASGPYNEFGLGKESEVVPGGWVYQESEPPTLFNLMVVAGVGYSAPLGDFYSGLEAGELYFAEVCLSLSPRKYLRLGYRSMRGSERSYTDYDYSNDSVFNYHSTVDLRQYNLTLGMLSRPNKHNKVRYYTEFGLGIIDHLFKTTGYSERDYQSNATRVLLVGKGGILFPVVGDFGVDVGASMASKLFLGNNNEGYGFLMDVQVGLTYKFGGE